MKLKIFTLLLLSQVLQEDTAVNSTTSSRPSYELLYSITDRPRDYKFTMRSKFAPDAYVVVLQAIRIHNLKNYGLHFFPILSLEWERLNLACCSPSNITAILKHYQKNTFCVSEWDKFGVAIYVTNEVPTHCSKAIKVGKIKKYNTFGGFLEKIKKGIALVYYYMHNIDMVGDKTLIEQELVLVNKVVKIIDEQEGKVQYYISIMRHNTDEIWIIINEKDGGIDESELNEVFSSNYWVMKNK